MAVKKKKRVRRDVDGTKIVLEPSPAGVRSRGRKPDKWFGVLEEGHEKFGTTMFHVWTWKGRERAYRVRKNMENGTYPVPGGASKWEFVVQVRECRGGERSHDGKMSELHARRRR